jgi:putative tryptophan/tyrosine transport system substrate-binding protein
MWTKLLLVVWLVLQALSHVAEAQQPGKIPRIGILWPGNSGASAPQLEGLQEGLRQYGYVEGKSILIEYRLAEGKLDRLADMAAELLLYSDVVGAIVGTRLKSSWPSGFRPWTRPGSI